MAIVQAPVRMLAHSLFVVVALTGIKLEWKSPRGKPPPSRGASRRPPAADERHRGGPGCGRGPIDASALVWLMPVALPLLRWPSRWPS